MKVQEKIWRQVKHQTTRSAWFDNSTYQSHNDLQKTHPDSYMSNCWCHLHKIHCFYTHDWRSDWCLNIYEIKAYHNHRHYHHYFYFIILLLLLLLIIIIIMITLHFSLESEESLLYFLFLYLFVRLIKKKGIRKRGNRTRRNCLWTFPPQPSDLK